MSATRSGTQGRSAGRTRRSRRRIVVRFGLAAALALVGFSAWTTLYLLQVREDSRELEGHLSTMQADATTGTYLGAQQVADIQRAAAGLRSAADGPPLRILAAIPWVGEPFRVTADLSRVVDSVASQALPAVVAGTREVLGRPIVVDGAIDVRAIRAAAPSLSLADTGINRALREARRIPADTWAGPVDTIRARVVDRLVSLDRSLSSASLAADLVPGMLGADRPQTIAVVVENDSEARATGGLAAGLVVVRFDRGRMRVLRIVEDLAGPPASPIDLGADYRRLYGFAQPTQLWQTSNLSPSFPKAARIWQSLTLQRTGLRPDIVVGIDSHALSSMLRVVGGVVLADGRTVTADNVIPFIGIDSYQQFDGDRLGRKTVMGQIARLTLAKAMEGRYDARNLVRKLADAAAASRITVWSSSPSEQAQISVSAVAGDVPFSPDPYLGVFVNNAYGSKLDYFLERDLRVVYGACSSARQQMIVALTLTNSTPPGNYSPEVLGTFLPYVQDGGRLSPRSTRSSVYLLSGWSSRVTSVSLDGKPASFGTGVEGGHPVTVTVVDLAPDQPVEIRFALDAPRSSVETAIPRQPLTRPMSVTTVGRPCTP